MRKKLQFYPHRYLCSILDEMRELDKTKNYSGLLGLIEEAQIAANRMESGLDEYKDLKKLKEEMSKLKKDYNDLYQKTESLEKKRKNSK